MTRYIPDRRVAARGPVSIDVPGGPVSTQAGSGTKIPESVPARQETGPPAGTDRRTLIAPTQFNQEPGAFQTASGSASLALRFSNHR
jgi:hypothetical protein